MLGELVGTFLFLFFAFFGAQTTLHILKQESRSSLDAASLLYVSCAFGASLTVNAFLFGHVSGAMFNPAVSLASGQCTSMMHLSIADLIDGRSLLDYVVPGSFPFPAACWSFHASWSAPSLPPPPHLASLRVPS